MNKGIIGKKIGMTQVFDDKGNMIPVTVIEAGPCSVVQKKTVETDGYNAIQLGFEDIRSLQEGQSFFQETSEGIPSRRYFRLQCGRYRHR